MRQSSAGERVAFRKLTRDEYGNTIRDLLGVNFDVKAPSGLPEDPDWKGFERIGSVLTPVSYTHLEQKAVVQMLMHRQKLHAGDAEIPQVGGDGGMREAGVGAAQSGRHIRMLSLIHICVMGSAALPMIPACASGSSPAPGSSAAPRCP